MIDYQRLRTVLRDALINTPECPDGFGNYACPSCIAAVVVIALEGGDHE